MPFLYFFVFLCVSGKWNLAAGAAAYPYFYAQFYLRGEQGCWEVTHYETVLDWEGMYT